MLAAFVPLVAVLLGGLFLRDDNRQRAAIVTATAPTAATVSGAAGGQAATSTGAFVFTRGYGPVLGRSGPLRRFRVGLENGLGGDFAAEVDRALGDPRSWIAGRRFRLQRVPVSVPAGVHHLPGLARRPPGGCAPRAG